MIKKFNVIKMVSLLAWCIAIFAYFFQFPFTSISRLIIPFLAVYLVTKVVDLKFRSKEVFLLIVFIIYIAFSAMFSIVTDTGISRIVRFAFILLAILYCSFIKVKDFEKEINIFINIAVLKSFLLISVAIAIMLLGDYTDFRNWANLNSLGDIYFYNRFMPKVQVQGNALLVVAVIIEYLHNNKITKKLLILLLGVLFAGNFAYILGLGLFAIYVIVKWAAPRLIGKKKLLPLSIGFVIVCYIVAMPYLINKIEQKSEVSNVVRSEQAEVLLDANIIIGEGLGNYIKVEMPTRVYDGDIYFEMQTLYILNQIGIIGLLIFYCIVFLNIKHYGIERLIIYSIYLIYTFWNPYCFDTTQMMATLLIINVPIEGGKDEGSNHNRILSR